MAESRTVAVRVAVENVDQAICLLKGFGAEGEAALEQITQKSQQAGTSFARATDGMGQSAGAAKGALSNLRFQLQDVVVQAQAGTSAFTILAQQGRRARETGQARAGAALSAAAPKLEHPSAAAAGAHAELVDAIMLAQGRGMTEPAIRELFARDGLTWCEKLDALRGALKDFANAELVSSLNGTP